MSLLYSDAALCAFYAKEQLHMTNAQCWKEFKDAPDLVQRMRERSGGGEKLEEECRPRLAATGADGFICAFDSSFPVLNRMSAAGDRPFLLFYRGNLSLLEDLNKNVAVIGAIDPDDTVIEREFAVVRRLTAYDLNIVSGLAKGCDSAAHHACLEEDGKTIAVLPTHLGKIYPAANRGLAEQIVQSGGLLLTEYASEAPSRYASIKRFTDRDRLQAMFSKAVILIASHRKGQGDSGSRYALEAAKKYHIRRYVMFDQKRDSGQSLFGLNQDLLESDPDVKILVHNTIAALASERNPLLQAPETEQMKLDL